MGIAVSIRKRRDYRDFCAMCARKTRRVKVPRDCHANLFEDLPMRVAPLIFVVTLCLVSCERIPSTAQFKVRVRAEQDAKIAAAYKLLATRDLYDPASAQFRDVLLRQSAPKMPGGTSGPVLCGEINAKNQFGAYVGFRRFYVAGGKPTAQIEPPEFPTIAEREAEQANCLKEIRQIGEQAEVCRAAEETNEKTVRAAVFATSWALACCDAYHPN